MFLPILTLVTCVLTVLSALFLLVAICLSRGWTHVITVIFQLFFFLVLIFNDSDSTTVIHCVCKSTCANWFGLDLDYEFWFCILGFEL